MRRATDRIVLLAFIVATVMALAVTPATAEQLTAKERLGKKLFFDAQLSTPPGQSCSTCHDPRAGFADPRRGAGTSRGRIRDRFGSRNSPTIAYASFSPPFFLNTMMNGPTPGGVYEGGQNWDGRSSTLTDQAKLPFLNPLEMNNPDEWAVVRKVQRGQYAKLFRQVYGRSAFWDVDAVYDEIADAIAAYESSAEVNSFSSKYDAYVAGRTQLTAQEARGLALFEGKAACARCHPSRPSSMPMPMSLGPAMTMIRPPMFTSRHHANVGVPRNPANPFYFAPASVNPSGTAWVDLGTGSAVDKPDHYGRFKIPTLRNVARTAPYMHNGAFADLDTVVHFYNSRDVTPTVWPSPEWSQNIIKRDSLGNLGLTEQEMDDIVAFLSTLTDGWKPPRRR